MSKFTDLLNRLEKGRRFGAIPRTFLIGIGLILVFTNAISIWLGISTLLAALFAYLSALVLLSELLGQAWLKLGAEWMAIHKEASKQQSPESDEKIDPVLLWTSTFFWVASPIVYYSRKILGLSPCYAWNSGKEAAVDTYKLRFYALMFLLLAIEFDIVSRLFAKG